jgi:hypothetical protein
MEIEFVEDSLLLEEKLLRAGDSHNYAINA